MIKHEKKVFVCITVSKRGEKVSCVNEADCNDLVDAEENDKRERVVGELLGSIVCLPCGYVCLSDYFYSWSRKMAFKKMGL